jgi:hypothetical protein
MQTTEYVNPKTGDKDKLTELFYNNNNSSDVFTLYDKMNNRLFQLEEQGHRLVEQRVLTLKEKIILEKGKKAKKKLKRLEKSYSM